MIRNLILIGLFSLINNVSYSQTTLNDSLLRSNLFTPYQNYFNQDCEWAYTHFNKSAYIQGDDVWFTCYVLNPINRKLNFATSKLYVELWSPAKKLLFRKILYVQTGTASHFIHLSDTLVPGTYCFRTYTNWMRNFYQERDFNTLISLLGHDKKSGNELKAKPLNKSVDQKVQTVLSVAPDSVPGYDIQLLPESGTFLEGADNLFGIKALDPFGSGIKLTGKVFSADNQEISSFSTNESGMNNITIKEASNQQYTAKVTLPDRTIRDIQFPKAEPQGVIIHLDTSRTDAIEIDVHTNENTSQLNKQYLLMIHANGKLFKAFHIGFLKGKTIHKTISKNSIDKGIVYATLFDQNLSPVAERIFFNQDTTRRGNLTVKASQLQSDTVNLTVSIVDLLKRSQGAKLSISVLPARSHLNHFNNSLLSESILRPALRGKIENSDSYFGKNDMQQEQAIDNLLLTQGWRKYDWPAILKDTLPKFAYSFEEGFVVEGGVKNWLKNKPEQNSQITLLSKQNNLLLLTLADNAGEYKFKKLILYDSTSVVASASNNKGQSGNRVLEMSIPESIMGVPQVQPELIRPDLPKEIIGDIPRLTKGTILLSEVTVKSQKKNPFAENYLIRSMDEVLNITKENFSQFVDMEMLLSINFNVSIQRTSDGGFHINIPGGILSLKDKSVEPIMMIDGLKVTDPLEILNFPIDLVEAVAVNKSGLGGGMVSSSGTIAIKSRTKPLFNNRVEASNMKRLIVNGYAFPQKYYEPKYVIPPTSWDYEKYACVFWKPDLLIDSTNTASIRFYAPQSINTIAVRIEGISLEGKIFLHEQKITIPGRD